MYVYGTFPENTIDHINRIKTDNRLVNLRDVTVAENNRNKSPRMPRKKMLELSYGTLKDF